MGAGTTEDHYIQDAGELYVVYLMQKELEWLGRSSDILSGDKWKEFMDYCNDPLRNILDKFRKSDYFAIIEEQLPKFITGIIDKYDCKMTVKSVEVEYRNMGKKGDFIIILDSGDIISVSLKVYKQGFDSIQLCSGTWQSFVNGFFFEKAGGPGMYINGDGVKFKGSTVKERNAEYLRQGNEYVIDVLDEINIVNQMLKNKYIKGDFAEFYDENVKKSWKKDCGEQGTIACNLVKECLEKLPNKLVKDKILKMGDLYNCEEILLMSKKGCVSSLLDEKYKSFIDRISSETSKLELKSNGQSLGFHFTDDIGDIVKIDVPFTFNANGAWWHADKKNNPLCEPKFHKKEDKILSDSQRRPKKSKEMATSTNMWLNIKGNYTL